MASKPFDATLKDLVECGPDDWPVLAKLPAAPTRIIDADIATVSGAWDKVLRVETKPPYLLHLLSLPGAPRLADTSGHISGGRDGIAAAGADCGRDREPVAGHNIGN